MVREGYGNDIAEFILKYRVEFMIGVSGFFCEVFAMGVY